MTEGTAPMSGEERWPEIDEWIERPEEPEACPECGSRDFDPYMPGMHYNGWKCERGHLFWTHTGELKPTAEVINEYKKQRADLVSEVERLQEENERLKDEHVCNRFYVEGFEGLRCVVCGRTQ